MTGTHLTLLVQMPAKHVWMLENHVYVGTSTILDFPGVAKEWHDTCC